MNLLIKAYNAAANFVKEPNSNSLTGTTALSCAFGLACGIIFTLGTGHQASIMLPSVIGQVVALGAVKTASALHHL